MTVLVSLLFITMIPIDFKITIFFPFSYLLYYKYKEKLVISQSIGIIFIKSKETRVITYTCRYSSGHLIPDTTEL